MGYEGFTILINVLIIFAIVYLGYYIVMNVERKWSILIITAYVYFLGIYTSFFPIT